MHLGYYVNAPLFELTLLLRRQQNRTHVKLVNEVLEWHEIVRVLHYEIELARSLELVIVLEKELSIFVALVRLDPLGYQLREPAPSFHELPASGILFLINYPNDHMSLEEHIARPLEHEELAILDRGAQPVSF